MSQKSATRKVTLLSNIIPKTYKYACNCIKCEGKEVEARTQEKHANNKDLWISKRSREKQLGKIEGRKCGYKSKIINLIQCWNNYFYAYK